MHEEKIGEVEKEWNLIKDIIVKTTQKVYGWTKPKMKRLTNWWNEKTINIVKRKIIHGGSGAKTEKRKIDWRIEDINQKKMQTFQ